MKESPLPVLSLQAVKRMPAYLHYLRSLRAEGTGTISSARAAEHFGFTEIQVRKDFSAFSTGRPKAGFSVDELIEGVETYLGFRNAKEAVLVGVGSLGRALLSYGGFDVCGVRIIAAFDQNPALIGATVHDKLILPAEKIAETCGRLQTHIGIITVPAAQAQGVCDRLVAGGVLALWNFAPVHLSVPDGVLVQNEDMAISLALLSRHLQERMKG